MGAAVCAGALAGAALATLLLVGAFGATAVFAQEPEPETETPFAMPFGGRRGFGRGGMMGPGMFDGRDGSPWTRFDLLAEALGLEPEELFTALREGKTVAEIAEAQGVDLETLQQKLEAERVDVMRAAIEQAVSDGDMDAGMAEWLLEGLDKGYLPRARGFSLGCGPGRGRLPAAAPAEEEA